MVIVLSRFKANKKLLTGFLVYLLDFNMEITLKNTRTWYLIIQKMLTKKCSQQCRAVDPSAHKES